MSGLIKAQLNDVSGSNSYIFTPDIKIRWAYEKNISLNMLHTSQCMIEVVLKNVK